MWGIKCAIPVDKRDSSAWRVLSDVVPSVHGEHVLWRKHAHGRCAQFEFPLQCSDSAERGRTLLPGKLKVTYLLAHACKYTTSCCTSLHTLVSVHERSLYASVLCTRSHFSVFVSFVVFLLLSRSLSSRHTHTHIIVYILCRRGSCVSR